MKKVKAMVKAASLVLALLISAPAWASPDEKEKEKPPAAEGAGTAYGLIGGAMTDGLNLMRQGADKTVEETQKAAQQMSEGMQKAGEKTLESGRVVVRAVTDEKVQAGTSGGLAVGLPAGGAAYLIAAAAGASNPIVAAGITTAVVGIYVGAKTAEAYEKEHPGK